MSDIDKLRREFDRKKRATEFIEGSPLAIADTLIAALEAEAAKEALLAQEAFERMQKAEAMKQEWMKAANVNLDRAEAAEAEAKSAHALAHVLEEDAAKAEAEVDRLAWMLKVKVASHCKYGERGPGGVERCDDCQATLADLAARYDAAHPAPDKEAEQNPQYLSTSSDVSITPLHANTGDVSDDDKAADAWFGGEPY